MTLTCFMSRFNFSFCWKLKKITFFHCYCTLGYGNEVNSITWSNARDQGHLMIFAKVTWVEKKLKAIFQNLCLNGRKPLQSHLTGKNANRELNWLNKCVNEENLAQGGLSAPAPGLYTCIWPPFQRSSFLKPLGQSNPNFKLSLLGNG